MADAAKRRAASAAEARGERARRRRVRREAFRGPAADSALGERCIDVLPIVSASGFAAEVSQCRWLCGETWRAGDLGATNDMLVRSAEIQCGAQAARETRREDFVRPGGGGTLHGTTQLIRAALLNNLPRVLQLVQLGAPIDLVDATYKMSALYWASREGHEHVAKALLDGKYEGRGADVNLLRAGGWTPLMYAVNGGDLQTVKSLVARQCNVNVEGKAGGTPLGLRGRRQRLVSAGSAACTWARAPTRPSNWPPPGPGSVTATASRCPPAAPPRAPMRLAAPANTLPDAGCVGGSGALVLVIAR